ncbi:hypothetical protein J6590_076803 [Homalodisca vitripennis]|nr:hypothetical protein J6590_076803 [Homalodisca vitripennis]
MAMSLRAAWTLRCSCLDVTSAASYELIRAEREFGEGGDKVAQRTSPIKSPSPCPTFTGFTDDGEMRKVITHTYITRLTAFTESSRTCGDNKY